MFYHYTSGKKPQYLISPRFAGNVPMTVLFYYMAYSDNDTFQVGYSTTTSDVGAFTWGGEMTTVRGQWLLYENNFPVGTRFVAVKYTSNKNNLYLDDFAFLMDVGPKPTSLAVGGLTDTNAVLTWTAPETANTITGYAYQYKKVSDASWSAETTTTATSATLNGLTGDTDYEFRVKTLYGDEGSTYATLGFVTAMPLPYECGFENGMERWGLVDINWGYTGIQSNVNHVGENGFMFDNFLEAQGKKPQYLISPQFAGNVPMTVLFYYMAYSDNDTFQVGYSTTTGDVGAFTWGEEMTTVRGQWSLYENNFPVGTRFVAVKYTSNKNNLYLDDFIFMVNYGPKPANLAVGGVTATNAVLAWIAPETANTITGYAYQYKKTDDASWSAEATTTATSASLDGLTGDTDYEFRVKTLYGDNASTYGTLGFVTAMPLPYECGFENGMDRWGLVDINWGYTGSQSNTKHDGEYGFRFSAFTSLGHGPQYLISPRFSTENGLTVSFYHFTDCTTDARFDVGYSTTDDATGSFTWVESVMPAYHRWTHCEQTFPAGTRYVAVRYDYCDDKVAYTVYLDDFNFEAYAPYAKPSDLAVGILTDTNATLTWTASDGSPTGYAWQCRKLGDADWSAEVAVAGTSATLDGLTANTTYDFRVKALYGNDEASNFATVRFTAESPVTSLPYDDGFENGMGGWRVAGGAIRSEIITDLAHNGSHCFKLDLDNDKEPQYIMSPWFDGSSAMTVSFWYRNYDDATHTYPAHFHVGYSTTTRDPAAFSWSDEKESDYVWQQYATNFPAGTKFVAVKWTDGYWLYLDDFSFTAYTYADWAADHGVAGAWDAKDADGVANVFRYLFGHPTGAFDDPPLLTIEPTADGHLVAHTPELVNTNGFTCALSSADDPAWTSQPATQPLDPTGTTPIDDPATPARSRFFRLKATPERGGAAQ